MPGEILRRRMLASGRGDRACPGGGGPPLTRASAVRILYALPPEVSWCGPGRAGGSRPRRARSCAGGRAGGCAGERTLARPRRRRVLLTELVDGLGLSTLPPEGKLVRP